jgi:peptidoglycan/xylan/chitin deacetylase (PgdA/CDA1 family)
VRVVAVQVAAAFGVAAALFGPPDRLPVPLPARTLRVPILMYHRVGRLPRFGDRYPGLTVQPRIFAEQMEWLAEHDFHAISAQQLFDALEWGRPVLPSRPVLITFDDGYRDVLWNAEPILHRLHMPAIAFVITDRISGHDPSFLTWNNLRDLERDGFTIGSHTVHHFNLTTLSPAQVWLELRRSRQTLQEHLRVPVAWLSYPVGAQNPAVVRLVRRAGYLLAVTEQPGFAQSAREPFLLHRDEIGRSAGVAGLASLLRRA